MSDIVSLIIVLTLFYTFIGFMVGMILSIESYWDLDSTFVAALLWFPLLVWNFPRWSVRFIRFLLSGLNKIRTGHP